MTQQQRLEYRKTDLLQRIESGRPFSVSAYLETEQISWKTVYPVLLQLEREGRIRRSGEQSIHNRGALVMVPSFVPVLDKTAFPESLTPRGVDSDHEINREQTAIWSVAI